MNDLYLLTPVCASCEVKITDKYFRLIGYFNGVY